MPSGHWQNGMMSALWEMGCKEDSEYHQVVGDGAGGQGSGPIRRIRVVESQVRVIERGREAFNTPRITNSTDTLQGYVPRLGRHEDFGRIFEGVNKVRQKACMHTIATNDIRAGEGRAGIGMRAPGSE